MLREREMELALQQIVYEEQSKMKAMGFSEAYIGSNDAKCSIFLSGQWERVTRLLLIIVSGNGIQPGIWSRSLVMEPQDTTRQYYRSGSMLPYLHKALSLGYGVIVTNPSTNMVVTNRGDKVPIPYSSTPEEHVRYVWEAFAMQARCHQVYIAAYGRGGVLAKHLLLTQPVLRQKLAAIAFIESSHRVSADDPEDVRTIISTRAINWQRSAEVAGRQLPDCAQLGCLSLSAGEPQATRLSGEQRSTNTAWTIAASMETVFAFFDSARGYDLAEEQQFMEQVYGQQPTYTQPPPLHPQPPAQGQHEDGDMVIEHVVDTKSRVTSSSMVISTSMSVADFDLLSVVGKGAYGKVFLARKKAGRNAGRIYAMKVLRKEDVFRKKQVEHTMSEQRILKHVEHPFVVHLRYAFQSDYKLYLVMDYYHGGSLFVHLKQLKHFPEARARFYAAELALAMSHLHSLHIMYRDLKLENILMDADGHVAITDFGLSKEDDEGSTFVGTPEYLAPELLSSQRTATSYGKSVDWWSFGVLVYEMIRGQTPFYDKNRRAMFQNILTKEPPFPPTLFSPTAIEFLQALLVKNPAQRLGCGPNGPLDIMHHPWFTGIDWQALLERRVDTPFRPNIKHGQDIFNYVPASFLQQDVADSPVVTSSVLSGSMPGRQTMHFDNFSYMGSDIMGSRRTSLFRESDFRMDEDDLQ
ncbi:AGC protein kinase, variant [Aphanomyces invadans]|uniref:AGC protein kinase, variant n=1 Tax=Aphanomyces invadans TaxID=157072 RepID=A0A024TYK0_9STRA|nr:AGC protein kinase, variant [Aphanomyces invadans]ETV99069.1 AGC protein kinase, variant [Aphanomyces invadans]|eukprot:XP_008872496.1 AGC protein kinase, variant [Aphanomyces invadans]